MNLHTFVLSSSLVLCAACATLRPASEVPALTPSQPPPPRAALSPPPPAPLPVAPDAHALAPTLSAGEQLLSSGGELDLSTLPAATVTRTADRLIAVGQTEVPAGSRLQAALALVDAVARAELVASVRSGVATLERSSEEVAGARTTQSVEVITAQAAQGLLPGRAPARHGWQKVRRAGEEVLRLWAVLEADRAAVEASLAKALPGDQPEERARRAVERMASPQPVPQPLH